MLEALDEGRLTIGEGTLLEPGCWLTLAPEARIEIGAGCFLNRNVMIAAQERVTIGDHTMFANGCFVGDAEHRYDDATKPITWQGFTSKGPVAIGANCWFGVNCAVTSGVSVGDRCVVGANSVVTRDVPDGDDRGRRAGEADPEDRLRRAAGGVTPGLPGYWRKPVASTALRTCAAVFGLSKAPSGARFLEIGFSSRPATEACRASTVQIEAAAAT